MVDSQISFTPLNSAANQSREACVALLLADGRVDVNRDAANGQTPLLACEQLAEMFDQVGASEPPTRSLVLLLKSRRIDDYYMKESVAFLRIAMPTRRQIATAEAGGEPLIPTQKMVRLLSTRSSRGRAQRTGNENPWNSTKSVE